MGEFSDDDDLDGLAEDDLLALEEVTAMPTQSLSLPLSSYAQQYNAVRSNNHSQNSLRPGSAAGSSNKSYTQQIGGVGQISRHLHTVSNQPYEPPPSRAQTYQGPGPNTQREQWRQSRYAATTPGLQRAATVGNINLPHREASTVQAASDGLETVNKGPASDNGSAVELTKLRAEVEAMRSEQENLRSAAKIANNQMLAKSGEISILRSNQTKIQQDFEKRIEDLQKKHMLDHERHQAELDDSRKERERLASYNQFMVHERNDESWQLKQGQKSAAREKENTNPERKALKNPKSSHFGDGFDDDEVMIISPTKSISKSRNTTPKGGLKRKRDVLGDSPMKQLELSQSIVYLPEADPDLQPISLPEHTIVSNKHQDGFKFLQQLLNRQISKDERRTYEVLSGCFLPSDTRRTLSTILTSEMASMSQNQDLEDFPTTVGHVVLALWSKCLHEKYHKPIRYLIDLVEFTLLEGSNAMVANLIDEVVDLAQRTADVNVIPRYKRFKRKAVSDDPDNRPLDTDINTKQCLELLDLTITLCKRDQDLVKRFWKSMRFDFISMLLRNSQDVGDVTLMVKILSRSVRIDTFAMIVAPPASQSVSEQHVIDRLSAMLIEVPRVLEGEQQSGTIEICNMRLEILSLIETMISKVYCGEAFAIHPAALGRLVRVMHDELNALYDYRHGHEKRAELVNQSTRLIYTIIREYEAAVGNLQEKLRAPPTSVYKYLIALSRLAFSEGVVFEQDIDEDVLEMAHEMLELFTSPDEAEAIQKAFVRDGSTRTATATAQTTGQTSG